MSIEMLNENDLGRVDKAPNFAYLDGYGNLHVWHKPAEAMHANTKKDPVNIKVDLDCFGGYPVLRGANVQAGIKGGKLFGTDGYPVLKAIVLELAEREGIKVL